MLNVRFAWLAAVVLALIGADPARGDEAPHARAVMEWLDATLVAVDADMASISRAAEIARDALLAGGAIGVRGERGRAAARSQRAGGGMVFDGGPGGVGDVIVYALGIRGRGDPDWRSMVERQLVETRDLRDRGSVVIGLVSVDRLRRLDLDARAAAACDALLDNHVAATGAIVDRHGELRVPVTAVSNAAVAWAWACEIFSACTRSGRTIAVDLASSSGRRNVTWPRRWRMRFHERSVPPIAPGRLGRDYVKALRATVLDVSTTGWPSVVAAAYRGADAMLDGGRCYLWYAAEALGHQVGGRLPADPRVFHLLDHLPDDASAGDEAPTGRDFVMAAGTDEPPGSVRWGEPDRLRRAGRGVAWLCRADLRPGDLRRDEIHVDPLWPDGDALVAVPGYDTRMAPASGVVGPVIVWAIAAEIDARITEHRRARRR